MPEYFVDLESYVVEFDTTDPNKAWDMAIEWLKEKFAKGEYPKISNVEIND